MFQPYVLIVFITVLTFVILISPVILTVHLCYVILYPAAPLSKHVSASFILLIFSVINVQNSEPYKEHIWKICLLLH